MTLTDAQKTCVGLGGHLVAYTSIEEQQDVEQVRWPVWLCVSVCSAACLPVPSQPPSSNAPTSRLCCPPHLPQFFISNGYMLVDYYKVYWLGMRAEPFPDYKWLDPGADILQLSSSYKHWGVTDEGREPQAGKGMVKECGVANASLSYEDAWGWSAEGCANKNVFMCKAAGKSCSNAGLCAALHDGSSSDCILQNLIKHH